jgi:hypothetical protein
MPPARFRPGAAERIAHGPALERLVPLFDRTDPLADAVMADFASLPRAPASRRWNGPWPPASRAFPRRRRPCALCSRRWTNRVAARLNRLPLWRSLATTLGDRYWDAAITGGLGQEVAAFRPPPALVGGGR